MGENQFSMPEVRSITKVFRSIPTIEGAGVHLRRAFGFGELPQFDPFLLLDDFRSQEPRHYLSGFPWHPHRGIETITYVLRGEVEHGDSLGNNGKIGPGDVQWMTAGSGIIHQEMPKGDAQGRMGGFQLWANLPAADKMMRPRYREVKHSQIPMVSNAEGTTIRVICGEIEGKKGPVQDIVTDPEYLDVTVPPDTEFRHATKRGHTVFAYVFEGGGYFSPERRPFTYERGEIGRAGTGSKAFFDNGDLILFGNGDQLFASSGSDPMRFLLVSGKPLREPVAWQGPIVMNTDQELRTAFQEYRNGTFVKS